MPEHVEPEPDSDAEAVVEPEAEPEAEVRLNRRERRAKQNGAPGAAVQGPPGGRRMPVPAKPRDYASRRRGG